VYRAARSERALGVRLAVEVKFTMSRDPSVALVMLDTHRSLNEGSWEIIFSHEATDG
jgi:hypothetical protein